MSSSQMKISMSKPAPLVSSHLLPSCFAVTVNNSTILPVPRALEYWYHFQLFSTCKGSMHPSTYLMLILLPSIQSLCSKVSKQTSNKHQVPQTDWMKGGFASHRRPYLNLTDKKMETPTPAKQVVFACSYQLLIFWFSTYRYRKMRMIQKQNNH